ncbi:MAG: HD domain-containing phosphohydrolase [Rhodoferax sp.]|nr:HD domain-containing protein [Rhodoferax sp.]
MDDKQPLNHVNTHVLNAILDAAQGRAIVASRDIFDERGIKLLAHHMPITPVLQQRLLSMPLKHPLETSLRFEAGPDKNQLRRAFAKLMDSGHALVAPLRSWARDIDAQITSLPLDPVGHFLLSTVQANSPQAFDHAIQAMALAGAMALRARGNPGDVRLAMLAGLLHDIGELYLDPALIGAGDVLDLPRFAQMAVHPQRGEQLLASLGHYPGALTRAIGEHHERLDGSGYPARLTGDKLSPLGRLLCIVEATLGMLALPGTGWIRASFALRVIPGEFDAHLLGLVAGAAADAARGGEQVDIAARDQAWAGLADAGRRMQAALALARALSASSRPRVRDAAEAAARLLERLRAGWNDMGLWAGASVEGVNLLEVAMADEELHYRLGRLERNCLWHVAALDADDQAELAPLWASLAR